MPAQQQAVNVACNAQNSIRYADKTVSTSTIQDIYYHQMPVEITKPASVSDIKSALQTWLDLLAKEHYLEAFLFTVHDPYYHWTPELLELVINGYGRPYEAQGLTKCKVTDWTAASADNGRHYKEISLFGIDAVDMTKEIKFIGEIYYNLPIDYQWSDLTATFRILEFPNYTTLELNEIHVM